MFNFRATFKSRDNLIVRAYDAGYNMSETAVAMGINHHTVRRVLLGRKKVLRDGRFKPSLPGLVARTRRDPR